MTSLNVSQDQKLLFKKILIVVLIYCGMCMIEQTITVL